MRCDGRVAGPRVFVVQCKLQNIGHVSGTTLARVGLGPLQSSRPRRCVSGFSKPEYRMHDMAQTRGPRLGQVKAGSEARMQGCQEPAVELRWASWDQPPRTIFGYYTRERLNGERCLPPTSANAGHRMRLGGGGTNALAEVPPPDLHIRLDPSAVVNHRASVARRVGLLADPIPPSSVRRPWSLRQQHASGITDSSSCKLPPPPSAEATCGVIVWCCGVNPPP